MKQTFTVTIQSNIIGGKKVAYTISSAKAYKLCQILEPEEKRRMKREQCSSIQLNKFFTETN